MKSTAAIVGGHFHKYGLNYFLLFLAIFVAIATLEGYTILTGINDDIESVMQADQTF